MKEKEELIELKRVQFEKEKLLMLETVRDKAKKQEEKIKSIQETNKIN
jgi:hypothetical protein